MRGLMMDVEDSDNDSDREILKRGVDEFRLP